MLHRNSIPQSSAPQTSNVPFSGNNQLQFQSQQPTTSLQMRQISQPSQPQQQQQQQQLQQQQLQQQQSHLRSPNSSNIPVGYWPNSYKLSPPQTNMNSIFNTNMLNKQPLFDTPFSQVR